MMTIEQWAALARRRLAPLLTSPPDPEFVEELAGHLAQVYEDARRDGQTDAESRETALALLAESSPWVEAARERARTPAAKRVAAWVRHEPPPAGGQGGLVQKLGITRDVRHALRMLLRAPAFSLVAILTFAVGIGANTAVFSVVNGVLLRALPYPQSDRITMVWIDNRREH